MAWESYYSAICKAKEEYDRAIEPVIQLLHHAHKEAWEKYVLRIAQAEKLLTEEQP